MSKAKKEVRATVARTNDAIALYDGRLIPAKKTARFGKGKNMCKQIGWSYVAEIDGKTFKGNAKGAQDFITLVEV